MCRKMKKRRSAKEPRSRKKTSNLFNNRIRRIIIHTIGNHQPKIRIASSAYKIIIMKLTITLSAAALAWGICTPLIAQQKSAAGKEANTQLEARFDQQLSSA